MPPIAPQISTTLFKSFIDTVGPRLSEAPAKNRGMLGRARRQSSQSSQSSPEPATAPWLRGALADVLPLLRCPHTGNELEPGPDGSLVAEGRRYPVVEGVPVLIDEDRSLVDIRWALEGRGLSLETTARMPGIRPFLDRALRRLPASERNVAAARNHHRMVELLQVRAASGRRPRVLVIGGRTARTGSQELLACADLEVVETDIAFGPRTRVVCDAHDLPFASGAFDAVVIRSVLDCTLDPERVASEVHRVLAGDGLVYSEAGFIRQAHGGAFDFNRFTQLGHRRLWRFFDEVDSGAHWGPGTALLRSADHFLRASAGESRLLRAVAERVVALAGFWITYLDHLLARRPGGVDAASGTFFLGTRRETAIPDRVIVAGFRGVLPYGQRLPAPRPTPAPEDEIRVSRGIRILRRERAPGL
jgi:SAM-dependent methyltransferase